MYNYNGYINLLVRIGADVGEEESANKYKSAVHIFALYFLQQVLCRFIQSTDID